MNDRHTLHSWASVIEAAKQITDDNDKDTDYTRGVVELIGQLFGVEADEVEKALFPYVATYRCALYFDVKTANGEHPIQAQIVNGLLRTLPEYFGSRALWIDELEEIETSSDPAVLPDSKDLPSQFWSTYVTIEVPA